MNPDGRLFLRMMLGPITAHRIYCSDNCAFPLWSDGVAKCLGTLRLFWMSPSPPTATCARLKWKAIQLNRSNLENKACSSVVTGTVFLRSAWVCGTYRLPEVRQRGSLSAHTWQHKHLPGLHRQLLFSVFPKVLLSGMKSEFWRLKPTGIYNMAD